MDRARQPIDPAVRIAAYRLVAELLLYPEQRDGERIDECLAMLREAPASVREPIEAFLASSRSDDPDEYLGLLEMTPPCPLYLGAYLFEEPSTCRGAAMSGRNAYMMEVAAIYRHFGFEIGGGELADFVPAMVEFLALSLEHHDCDGIGLRRRFIEHYMESGLAPMRAALEKYETPYAYLIQALEAAADEDIAASAGEPLWVPPAPIHRISLDAIEGARRASSDGGVTAAGETNEGTTS